MGLSPHKPVLMRICSQILFFRVTPPPFAGTVDTPNRMIVGYYSAPRHPKGRFPQVLFTSLYGIPPIRNPAEGQVFFVDSVEIKLVIFSKKIIYPRIWQPPVKWTNGSPIWGGGISWKPNTASLLIWKPPNPLCPTMS